MCLYPRTRFASCVRDFAGRFQLDPCALGERLGPEVREEVVRQPQLRLRIEAPAARPGTAYLLARTTDFPDARSPPLRRR